MDSTADVKPGLVKAAVVFPAVVNTGVDVSNTTPVELTKDVLSAEEVTKLVVSSAVVARVVVSAEVVF